MFFPLEVWPALKVSKCIHSIDKQKWSTSIYNFLSALPQPWEPACICSQCTNVQYRWGEELQCKSKLESCPENTKGSPHILVLLLSSFLYFQSVFLYLYLHLGRRVVQSVRQALISRLRWRLTRSIYNARNPPSVNLHLYISSHKTFLGLDLYTSSLQTF